MSPTFMRFSTRLAALVPTVILTVAFAVTATFGSPRTSAAQPGFKETELVALLGRSPRTGRPVDTIAELAPLLPRELRSNFTFVYDSRSPFKASIAPQHPRVILFSDDAKMVLTFTGDPAKPGADVLETMAFDEAKARFVLNAYTLPAARRRGFAMSPAASNCAVCHGADARPIYDSYPLWPGFYGSVLDTFPHDGLGAAELKKYVAFLATTAKTGVYAHLDFRKGSRTTPFLDPGKFRNDTVELDRNAFPFLPNARLGMALTELNRQRIYRKLAAGPRFAANEKRILANLLECRGADQPSRQALAATEAALKRENAQRLKRLGAGPNAPHGDLHDMQELSFVRELAEIDTAARLSGVDHADWSMAMETGSLALFDGILSGIYKDKSYYLKEDLIFEILSHLSRRDARFAKYFAFDAVFAAEGHRFGKRIAMGPALASCPLLVPRQPPSREDKVASMQL